ncbi:MAG: RadC family protein [Candidatus Avilachnospira sp.]|jgi:DNA repair protein RadC
MLNKTIKDLPKAMRPYEKCEAMGCDALTDAELLAIIIRTGSRGRNALELAEDILSLDKASVGILGLMHCSREDLTSLTGLGKVKATQLLAMAELSKRIWKAASYERLDFHDPETVAAYYMEEMRHLEREMIKLIFLNSRDALISEKCMSIGTVNASLTSSREIFIDALKHRAVSIILLHNHPGGNAAPSPQDISFTSNIAKAGSLVGIRLLDHIIIGDNTYYSFCERGLLDNG